MTRRYVPLLADAMPWIAHRAVRNRGTVCGSLARADPAAELPAITLALDASLVARPFVENGSSPRATSSKGSSRRLLLG